MTARPTCPQCGSHDIAWPGVCTFRWRSGKWRAIRHSIEMNEGADCFHCGSCGTALDGEGERPFRPPFKFTIQESPFK